MREGFIDGPAGSITLGGKRVHRHDYVMLAMTGVYYITGLNVLFREEVPSKAR